MTRSGVWGTLLFLLSASRQCEVILVLHVLLCSIMFLYACNCACVTTMTFCNPHQRIPEPSASFLRPQHCPQAHKLNPETLHSFPTPNTHSQSCLITPDPIGLNPIACTYLSLVLVPCLSLPHICYLTSTSFPPPVSLSSLLPSTIYHLTLITYLIPLHTYNHRFIICPDMFSSLLIV